MNTRKMTAPQRAMYYHNEVERLLKAGDKKSAGQVSRKCQLAMARCPREEADHIINVVWGIPE